MDAPAPSSRRLDLDWLRIAAFGLLILYHVGLLYVPWPYHAKSLHSLPALVPVLEAVNPWRLLLLFLISGVATRFMAHKRSLGRLLAIRSVRLLLPLAFGMLVVVPPQSFVQAVEQYGYTGSYLHFYGADYLGSARRLCNPSGCLALPTWNHLWFVLYLYAYTALLIGLLALAGRAGPLVRRVAGIGMSVPVLLVLPPLGLVATRVLLLSRYPPNDGLIGDWYNHATYGAAFLFGYAIAEHETAWAAAERWRWPALATAVLLLPSVWLGGDVPLAPPLGRIAVAPLLVDVAHGTMELVRRAAAVTTKPLVLSHTSLTTRPQPFTRLITSEHAKLVADTGGVIGIWPVKSIFPDMDALAAGMARVAAVAGADHVGLGTDTMGLVGPATFDSYAELPGLAQALLAHGFTPDEVRKMLGGNYARVFAATMAAR